MTVNFTEMRKQTPTIRANGWCKTITSLDKSVKNGYSIQGDFVRKAKGDLNYIDGLYLDCSKPKGQKNYHIFKVEDGEATVLQTLENPQGQWATQLWDTIDQALVEDACNVEYQAQQLANLVLENCNDTRLLNEVARILSKEYDGESFFKNRSMVEGFLGYNRCSDLPFALRGRDGEFFEHQSEWAIRNTQSYEQYLADGCTEHQAFFNTVVSDRWDISVEDIRNGDIDLEVKILNEFELQEKNQFHYNVPYWYFYGDYFGDSLYGIKEFDIRNFMIVGFSKGDSWNKPRLYVKLFTDELWKDYLGGL